jgi:hypothetical protein
MSTFRVRESAGRDHIVLSYEIHCSLDICVPPIRTPSEIISSQAFRLFVIADEVLPNTTSMGLLIWNKALTKGDVNNHPPRLVNLN